MNIEIKPSDIDQVIKESIIKSALGQNIQSTIDETIKNCMRDYDSPLKKYVHQIVKEIIHEHLSREENKKEIYSAITKYLTPETIEKMMVYGVKKFAEMIDENI